MLLSFWLVGKRLNSQGLMVHISIVLLTPLFRIYLPIR